MSRSSVTIHDDPELGSTSVAALSITCTPIPSAPSYLSRHPHLRPLIYIILVYILGGGLILYAKWFYNNNCTSTRDPLVKSFKNTQHDEFCPGYGFPFPLFTSCIQFAICFIVAMIAHYGFGYVIPSVNGRVFVMRILPLGICMGGYVALLNSAYLFVDASYLVELKQVGIVLTFLFACAIGLEQMTFKLSCLVFVVASGLLIASYGASHFSFHGALLVFMACIFSACHEVLIQLLTQHGMDSIHHFSPISILYYQSGIACIVLLPWMIWLDISRMRISHFMNDMTWRIHTLLIICGGGIVMSCYGLAHFAFVEITSALTYGMAHAFLSLAIIGISSGIFGTSVTALNIVGYATAFMGIIAYHTIRVREQLQEEKRAQFSSRITLSHSDWSKNDEDRITLLSQHSLQTQTHDDDDEKYH